MRDLAAGLRLATGTLTIIPVGTVRTDGHAPRWAMVLAPLAALPLAVAAGATGAAAGRVGLSPPVAAVLVVTLLGLLTRGMHLDGLADTVDALVAGWDRERALHVMHTGDVGPMGAAALVLSLLTQVTTITALVQEHGSRAWLLVAGAVVTSRSACAVGAARGVPAAERSGLGRAMAGSVPVPLAALVLVAAAGALVLCGGGVLPPAGAVACALAGQAAAGLLLRRCVRTIGGVTGDVFGAMIEVALCGTLVASGVRW